ncbi:MAG: plasmid recombination protein, partial [bacterium]|nr:plasmid recombination protein [bacterium]
NLVNDTKKLYLELFEESRINYNNKQTRDDRKINDYFSKIANDNKHDLAVEIIIELGNMYYWSDKTMEEKYKMVSVFEKQVIDLEKLIPSFKVANATIHFDESSPHLHIVGVPFKENCKTGMNRQVGKSDVFNVESLKDIQKELRESCIKEFNRVYNLNMELKEKEQGRNQDYRVSQMKDYDIFQKNYNNQQKKIKKVNDKTDVITQESNEIKVLINNLKQQPLNKNNLLLSNDNKEKILNYINNIESNNKEVKSLTTYSVSLSDIKKDLNDNFNTIYELRKENKELSKELDDKNTLLNNSNEKIKKLEKDIFSLEDKLSQWREKFSKLVNYFRNKVCGLFSNKNQDVYKEIVDDLYNNDILDDKDYNKINMKTIVQEKVSTKKERRKDDEFEL